MINGLLFPFFDVFFINMYISPFFLLFILFVLSDLLLPYGFIIANIRIFVSAYIAIKYAYIPILVKLSNYPGYLLKLIYRMTI